MLMEIIAPVQRQLNDMKQMNESTKACSQEVIAKVDEMKRALAYHGGGAQDMGSYSSSTRGPLGAPQAMDGILDPRVAKKGLEDLRD